MKHVVVLEVALLLALGFFEQINFLVHGAERIGAFGAEIFAAGFLGDLRQAVFIDADQLDRPLDADGPGR